MRYSNEKRDEGKENSQMNFQSDTDQRRSNWIPLVTSKADVKASH